MAITNKFFGPESLNEDLPKKAVKVVTKFKLIDSSESVRAVAARTSMGVFYEAIVITNKKIVYYTKDLTVKPFMWNVSWTNISGVAIETSNLGSRRLSLSLGGVEKKVLSFGFTPDELNKIYNFLIEMLDSIKGNNQNNNQNNISSSADELLKFKSLLDAGAISQEEYDIKKKQLLGL